MALEALKRNGHNLHIGEFEPEGKYGVPRLSPVRLSKRIDWLPFNCAKTDKRRSAHGKQDTHGLKLIAAAAVERGGQRHAGQR